MAVIKRGAVAEPTLPRETVEVEALGGEVVVRGLLLTERLAYEGQILQVARQAKAEGKEDAAQGSIGPLVPPLLAMCVLDADNQQLFTEQQWQVFGGKHNGQAVALFNVAWRLAGLSQAQDTKN